MSRAKQMKTFDIFGENRREKVERTRVACRGVVERGGKILLSYVPSADYYVLPGGGLEDGETAEECVVRELAEETGVVARAVSEFAVVNEYYESVRYETHYFVCEAIGQTERSLTDEEDAVGLEAVWTDAAKAAAIWSRHDDFRHICEEKRGSYLREHTAFGEYLKIADPAK